MKRVKIEFLTEKKEPHMKEISCNAAIKEFRVTEKGAELKLDGLMITGDQAKELAALVKAQEAMLVTFKSVQPKIEFKEKE